MAVRTVADIAHGSEEGVGNAEVVDLADAGTVAAVAPNLVLPAADVTAAAAPIVVPAAAGIAAVADASVAVASGVVASLSLVSPTAVAPASPSPYAVAAPSPSDASVAAFQSLPVPAPSPYADAAVAQTPCAGASSPSKCPSAPQTVHYSRDTHPGSATQCARQTHSTHPPGSGAHPQRKDSR